MINIQNLTKNYGSGRGIFDLTLEIPKGAIFGFIGPNGAGKTTTIKCLCGLLKPTSGGARVNDVPVKPTNARKIKRMIGYMPDKFGVYDQMSVWEYLDFFCAAYKISKKERRARIESVLELTNSTYMMDYQVSSLSAGMTRRIALAKTLVHDPAVLILDEPAAGLDPHARIEMRRTIMRLKEQGKTIMLSSHILPELSSICDFVGIVQNGRLLACGGVRDIMAELQEKIILSITVQGDATAAQEICKKHANIESATASGNEVRVTYAGTRAELGELNRALVLAGVNVIGFKEVEGDLEEVFLKVTGNAENKSAA